MMIVRGLREEGLRKLRPWFFGPPLFLGLGLAFSSIPFGSVTFSSCDVSSDESDHLWALVVFALIPAMSSALIILALLVIIYFNVRGDSRQESGMCWQTILSRSHRTNDSHVSTYLHSSSARRRHLGRSASPQQVQLEKRVFWQCLCYGVVFGITWPLWAWVTIEITVHGFPGRTPFALWVLVGAIIALAGFNNNAMCYFRYRIAHRLCHKSKRSVPPAQQPCEHSSTHPWKLFLARIAISSWFPNSAICDSSREEHMDAMNQRSIREDVQAAGVPNVMVSSLSTAMEEEDGRECRRIESEATIGDCCGKPPSSLAVAAMETSLEYPSNISSLESRSSATGIVSQSNPQGPERNEEEGNKDPVVRLANLSPGDDSALLDGS